MPNHEYSIQEAAELLGVPIPKLRRWDQQGVLVAVRTAGGHRRYPRELVDQIVNSSGGDRKLSNELESAKRALAEKRRVIQLLVESEGRYRDLVETSHDLIWATDAQGSFTYLNNAAQDIFGLAPGDLLGRCFFDFEVDAVHVANRRFLAQLRRNGEIKNYVTHLRSRSGEDRWIGINARVTLNDTNEIRGIRGTARDITEEYRAQLRIEHLAMHDALTDLPNRNAMHRALEQALESGKPGALLIMNFDHFNQDSGSLRKTHRRIHWAKKLRDALDNDQIVLFAQPIVRLSDRKITHHEILLRIRDDNGACVSPGAFMDIAETTGIVKEIDLRVVEKVLDHISSCGLARAKVRYFINLSGISMSSQDWVDRFMALLAASDVQPSQLGFEITETAALSDVEVAIKFIRRLKAIGCRISLDDFGSGFSSFYYLRQFDVDYVKIDGSFIRDLAGDHGSRLFVKALNDVAQGLNKQVIAEWVEGTQFAQGYYFHKPQLLKAPEPAGPMLVSSAA
jgi:PAS domain S-box-containing protein/excisionase family DNA binding protein